MSTGLILYSENSSPFSAPVRVALYAKGLDIAIEPPPGGLLSAQFHKINSLGTIPCLLLEGSVPLPESATIMEYLEDRFPERALLPANPEERARARLLQRIGELQIMTPLVELARQSDPAARDPSSAVWFTRLVRGLSALHHYLDHNKGYAAGPMFTLADCELAPALFMLPKIVGAYDKPDLLQAYPVIVRYLDAVKAEPAVSRVWEEMRPTWGRSLGGDLLGLSDRPAK
jgi:glutathione S-transferase